jgi:hypothetical protein
LNWIAAASMAQFQRAEWANLHLAAQLHAARTIGKSSCQKKRPEAAVRIERNLPSELKTTAKKQQPKNNSQRIYNAACHSTQIIMWIRRRTQVVFLALFLARGFSRGRATL